MNMLKKAVDFAEKLIWWYTWFVLWFTAVCGPILLACLILALLGHPISDSMTISHITIASQRDYVFGSLLISLLMLVAYLYVFRYRKTIDTRRDIKFIFVSCVLFQSYMANYYKIRHLRHLVNNAQLIDLQLSFVDSDTAKPLARIDGFLPPNSPHSSETLFPPPIMGFYTTDGERIAELKGVSIPGVSYEYTFYATGYETQKVSIGVGTGTRIIQLKKISKALNTL